MSTPNDGGSAFPCEGGLDSGLYADPGMSLRDWFAGHETLRDWDNPEVSMSQPFAEALTGEKRPEKSSMEDPVANFKWEAKWRAALRYLRADAMIAARDKTP